MHWIRIFGGLSFAGGTCFYTVVNDFVYTLNKCRVIIKLRFIYHLNELYHFISIDLQYIYVQNKQFCSVLITSDSM